MPDTLGPHAVSALDLRCTGPDGEPIAGAATILVSNNRYRLGRAVGSGTRPRIDDGLLGVTVVGTPHASSPHRFWREWSAPTFEVGGDRPVPAGIDGEAVELEPPLRFAIHPGVLRVRIARSHPGASPSALQPDAGWDGVRALARIAVGRPVIATPVEPAPPPGSAPPAVSGGESSPSGAGTSARVGAPPDR
jgi:hypothetical protein